MVMVSVICPTYNQGKYLRQGLDSIFAQKTEFSYEVLVGEDCSPDNTNEILAEYEERYPDTLHVFHREKNLKQSKNIYDLFMRAKGTYVITLDLDDYWTDEYKLQKQVEFLEKHPEYMGVAHDFAVIDSNGNPVPGQEHGISDEFLDKKFTLKDFEEHIFVYQTGTFLYRNIWKENKDYKILYESDDTVVDLTINSMLLLQGDIFIVRERMSAYRLVISHDDDATNARSVGQKDLALDYYKSCCQLKMLHKYFDKKVNYSRMWSNLVLSYIKNMMKLSDKRYSWKDWMYMFWTSSAITKRKVILYLLGSCGRKIGIGRKGTVEE